MIVYTFNRLALKSPLLFVAGIIGFAIWQNQWLALIGLLLVYIGWVGCSPNLNMANGCLSFLLTGITLAIGTAIGSVGLLAAGYACGLTWVAASIEAACNLQPVELTDEQNDSPHADNSR